MAWTPAGPLPGEPEPINAEIARLRALRDRLWAAADDVDHLSVDWAGPSHDRFAESKRLLTKRWRAAGDLHNDAMCTLERYRDERLELSRRAEDIDRAAWTDPAARLVAAEDIRRLRQQLGVLAGQAAIEIDRCAGTLNSFGRYETLPDLAASAAGPASFASPEPVASVSSQPAEPPGAINLDYTLDYGGASDIRRDVYVLGVEILLGRHEVLMGDLTAR